jgi:EAL domain-containing protein (putative c-di-GMP-specific phosphodiesterase class I)
MTRQRSLSRAHSEIDFEFSFAFQPIVDARNQEIISFEALVRGPKGESSASVLSRVSDDNLFEFDEACRCKAIDMASRLNIPTRLNINMAARGLHEVDLSITSTFKASLSYGFPVKNIVFEVIESESLTDRANLLRYLRLYQDFGFMTAFDDFGTGYSGLKLLAQFQPDFIKLDRNLIANIDQDRVKQSVFAGIRDICRRLSIEMIAEGVERAREYRWLRQAGADYFQGYYFARPAFEALPDVVNRVFSI